MDHSRGANHSDSYTTSNGSCAYSDGVMTVRGSMHRDEMDAFKRFCDRMAKSPEPVVTFDFTGCRYLKSVFIGYLVDTILRARQGGKTVCVRASPEVGRFFELAHLDILFDYEVVVPQSRKIGSGIAPAAKV